jgi:hypothetical protein
MRQQPTQDVERHPAATDQGGVRMPKHVRCPVEADSRPRSAHDAIDGPISQATPDSSAPQVDEDEVAARARRGGGSARERCRRGGSGGVSTSWATAPATGPPPSPERRPSAGPAFPRVQRREQRLAYAIGIRERENPAGTGLSSMGDTGLEPVTSALSRPSDGVREVPAKATKPLLTRIFWRAR